MDNPSAPRLTIGMRPIGGGAPCFIIAEIGTSHGGELAAAREMIERAAEAGVDCVKFQLVIAEEIVHPLTGLVDLPGGAIPLYERFRALERPVDFYAELKERTEGCGLHFLCTPFGPKSARLLAEIGVESFKIASPELNYDELLRQVASYDRPVILSSGVSTLGDIEHALEIVGRSSCALLHCITAYPAPPEEYNLRLIPAMESLFGVPVGLSDHSRDPILVPALAAAVGARVIEKHVTLSRQGGGLDDPIAVTPEELSEMVHSVRIAEQEGLAATRRRLAARYGEGTIHSVLGTGVKRLAPSERANYATTNRSIHAVRELARGTRLEAADLAVLRTEKRLRPGLPPSLLPVILGKRLARDVPSGEGIEWDDLLRAGDD
jgi:sialic acid synthase SpsE